ncbi:Exopolygalacturonase (Fragment) [Linum perenne]
MSCFNYATVLHLTYAVFAVLVAAAAASSSFSDSDSDYDPLNFASAPESPETLTESLEGYFDVTEHGAIADGQTQSQNAFLAAWEAACNHNGSGDSTFYVPEGIYFVGPMVFQGPCFNGKSPKIRIRGILVAPTSLSAFNNSNWIQFKNLNEIDLSGEDGMTEIDGRGAVEAWKQESCSKSSRCKEIVTSLKFSNVSHGTISNITLSNGKGFHLGFYFCNNIKVENITVSSPWDSPNTDGIHISRSVNITVNSSTIGVGDDCVSIGPGSVNVTVSNVQCGPGHGISIGSLGKYPDEEEVIGITVQNCTINGTQNGIRVKTWPGSPAGNASRIVFQNIVMINVSNPVMIDQEYCPSRSCNITKPSLVKLRDIHVKNVTGTYNSDAPTPPVSLLCSSHEPCENINLIDIDLRPTIEDGNPRQGLFQIKGLFNGLHVVPSISSPQ